MGKKWKLTDFIFLDPKITVDDDCSHEIKRHLLLGRKAIGNLDSILKTWYITLLTKVCIVKAMVFPAVMYDNNNNSQKRNTNDHENMLNLIKKTKILKQQWETIL